MKRLLSAALLLVGAGCFPAEIAAQTRARSFQRWEPPLSAAPHDNLHLSESRPNPGLVGGLVGIAIGMGLGVLANSAIKNAGDGVVGGAFPIVVGGLVGLLVGYGFGREVGRDSPDSPEAADAP